jgi:hypothetical protein
VLRQTGSPGSGCGECATPVQRCHRITLYRTAVAYRSTTASSRIFVSTL